MKRFSFYGFVLTGLLVFLCFPAFADEGAGDWRPKYDLIMRWVNFLILAGVIYKFGKSPLMDFLRGEKSRIAENLESWKKVREEAEAKVADAERLLADSKIQIEVMRERIVEMGERERQRLVDEAKEHGQQMIEAARSKIEGQIQHSRALLRDEMVDEAFGRALEKLPALITPEDDERLTDAYLQAVSVK